MKKKKWKKKIKNKWEKKNFQQKFKLVKNWVLGKKVGKKRQNIFAEKNWKKKIFWIFSPQNFFGIPVDIRYFFSDIKLLPQKRKAKHNFEKTYQKYAIFLNLFSFIIFSYKKKCLTSFQNFIYYFILKWYTFDKNPDCRGSRPRSRFVFTVMVFF